jgi:N-acetylglucosaminyl-diphospho-decaprenol L-rhamnosyltransferase
VRGADVAEALPLPRLSIIIVSYNSSRDLEACLTSLTGTPPQVDHEVVVVDNASDDGTPDDLRARWPGIRLIEAGENVGFARANNMAIRQTVGELVLLLNPDTLVSGNAIDRLVRVLDIDASVAIAGPRIVDREGRAELSFGRMISPLAELRQKMLVRGHDRGVPLISALVERMSRRSGNVDWVSGACLLVRRTDLEAVGLLDERFFLYTEDVDLCASIRQRGRKVLFVADVEIVHLRGRSVASSTAASHAAYRRSHLAFYEKHHSRWVPILKLYLRLRGK